MAFEKTLTDIVKGIRASKRDTALYISSCIAEIKTEINSTDAHIKANALQKLTFLQMMGYNMSWASFATIEVMSNTRFAYKRIGYLAASQAFTQDTDVVLLTINLLKKELRGAMVGIGMSGVYEAGLAINCLSNIVTEDLARELLPEVTNLTMHPQPYLRKKAMLCLLKLFMKYPQGLRLTFPRIQEVLLKDTNSSVTSCAVNVITELSDKNPKNYLVLAPAFFELLTKSSNNWMLIKVVKLLGSLVPEEPRLARKLLEPLAKIVQSTQAKSLLYEAVYTITLCLPYCVKADGSMPASVPSIVALCAETLKSFVQEEDQNLKYLGLVGFGSLMISHPKVLSAPDYRPLILSCLSDEDETIRTRALELLIGLTTRKNLMDLISQLLHHVDLATGLYKISLVEKIIELCSSEKYALVSDFAWYIDILVILARAKGLDGHGVGRNLGPLISSQIMDVTLRVLPVRSYAVRRMIGILLDGGHGGSGTSSAKFGFERNASILMEVLPVAAMIVGEYSKLIDEAVSMDIEGDDEDELFQYNPTSEGTFHSIIQSLTEHKNAETLSYQTQSIYIQAAMKVLAAAVSSQKSSPSTIEACVSTLQANFQVYVKSVSIEVQERAFMGLRLLDALGLCTNSSTDSEHKECTENAYSSNGNLLNLDLTLANSPAVNTKSSFVQEKFKLAAPTLEYIFIPEQMKPISTKSQRKKKSSLPAQISSLLDVNHTNVFLQQILHDEEVRLKEVGSISIEAVNFTSQVRPKVSQMSAPACSSNDLDDLFGGPENFAATIKDSQRAIANTIEPAPQTHLKANDPFYLQPKAEITNASNQAVSKFGTIQLYESDSEHEKLKKRKKKTKKRDKEMAPVDLELLNGIGNGSTRPHHNAIQVSIIDSDDDDDDDDVLNLGAKRNLSKIDSASNKNGFENLAMVDLTTPLREDEVMQISEHRQTQNRVLDPPKRTRSNKKKKKEKKAKKNKEGQKVETSNLLNISNETKDVMDSLSQGDSSKHLVNNVFDELLSLNNPLPAVPLSSPKLEEIGLAVSKTNYPLLWQKAVLKPNSSDVTFPAMTLFYKMHSPKNGGMKLSLRLLNASSSTLSDIQIQLENTNESITDTIAPGETFDLGKFGPYNVRADGGFKGTVTVQGLCATLSVPHFKILEMTPWKLNQNDVSQALANAEWHSTSVRVQNPNLSAEKVKQSLMQFLSPYEVTGDLFSESNYMFSCASIHSKLIVLAKISDRGIKFDIKCTDKKLGKSIASDFKRLVF
jgi:AP-3 complex subunit delta-1